MLNAIVFIIICNVAMKVTGFRLNVNSHSRWCRLAMTSSVGKENDVLVRALKGDTTRPPVWLMRQAGRYIKEFRAFSDKYTFRERSETPDIAVELSLQPLRKFGVDGVIFFSDILTPLPAMGIDFTMIENKGPKILNPIKDKEDIERMKHIEDGSVQLPFIEKILKTLRKEVEGVSTLVGFIGAPWTLAAYSVEGGQSKHCSKFKRMCNEDPALAHLLLNKLSQSLETYASYQIESGAQVIQIFDSWAHHMTEEQFLLFAKPYVNRIVNSLKIKHPTIPIIYFANGGSSFLHQQADMPVDALSIDWHISMARARQLVGDIKVLQGNVDPMVMYGNEQNIRQAVRQCAAEGRTSRGGGLILNLGHGVEKDTPEEAVAIFVDEAKKLA